MRKTKLNEIVKIKKEKKKVNKKSNFILLLLAILISVSVSAQKLHKVSYYSNKFNGRHTASGQLYNSKKYTCAHRTYAFGTVLKIKNPQNGKEVVVVVNDRGPHVKGIILDLSYAAAKDLGMIKQGIAKVEITVIDPFKQDSVNLVNVNDTIKRDLIHE